VRGGGIDFAGTIIGPLIAFGGQLIIARYLSVGNFGSLNLALKLLTFASIFGALGLGAGITRFVPRYSDPKEQRGVFVSGYQIMMVGSVLAMVLLITLSGVLSRRIFDNPDFAVVFRIIAVGIPANVLIRSTNTINSLGYVGPEVVVKSIIWPVLRIILIIIVAVLGGSIRL
jgi:O-antigen/teichoic acid export membrane protein